MKKLLGIVVLGFLWCSASITAETLGEQLVQLESLYKKGTINEQEFKKAKAILLKIDSNSTEKIKEAKLQSKGLSSSRKKKLDKINLDSSKKLNEIQIRKFRDSGRDAYEKMELLFNEYRFYTVRPGAVRVDNRKTGKKLAILTANLKIKYYDDSFKDKFEIISHKAEDRKFGKSKIVALHELEELGGKLNQFIAKGLNKAKKDFGLQSEELPGAIQIVYNGAQVINWERIYVPKFSSNFYQMTALSKQEPFHFYAVTRKGFSIAFNMEKFGKKIAVALEKVKVKIAKEYNLTVEEVEYVIEKKQKEDMQKLSLAVGEAVEKTISQEVEQQVSTQVASKIDTELAKELEKTIGEESAKQMMEAIEVQTGYQIDAALEAEVAAVLDEAVEEAIAEGYSQAAIEAGLAAYMAVLASGGTEAQAVAAGNAAGCAAGSTSKDCDGGM